MSSEEGSRLHACDASFLRWYMGKPAWFQRRAACRLAGKPAFNANENWLASGGVSKAPIAPLLLVDPHGREACDIGWL